MNNDGLLLLNKPVGISSFDCIRYLRRITGVRKIGHAGTLDPAASGLMLMLFGAACKQAQGFSKLDKTYVAEITLGATSTTGDREGTIIYTDLSFEFQPNKSNSLTLRQAQGVKRGVPTLDVVRDTLDGFVGAITQVPSIYSAIKINGQEAYKRARRGEVVEMPSREVLIHSIKLVYYEYPRVKIEVSCSSGTYIRTLALDIGERLGLGGYLSSLVRTGVGKYSLDDAVELDASMELIFAELK